MDHRLRTVRYDIEHQLQLTERETALATNEFNMQRAREDLERRLAKLQKAESRVREGERRVTVRENYVVDNWIIREKNRQENEKDETCKVIQPHLHLESLD